MGIEWVKTEASKEDVIRLVDDRNGRRLLVNFKRAGNITNRHSWSFIGSKVKMKKKRDREEKTLIPSVNELKVSGRGTCKE